MAAEEAALLRGKQFLPSLFTDEKIIVSTNVLHVTYRLSASGVAMAGLDMPLRFT